MRTRQPLCPPSRLRRRAGYVRRRRARRVPCLAMPRCRSAGGRPANSVRRDRSAPVWVGLPRQVWLVLPRRVPRVPRVRRVRRVRRQKRRTPGRRRVLRRARLLAGFRAQRRLRDRMPRAAARAVRRRCRVRRTRRLRSTVPRRLVNLLRPPRLRMASRRRRLRVDRHRRSLARCRQRRKSRRPPVSKRRFAASRKTPHAGPIWPA